MNHALTSIATWLQKDFQLDILLELTWLRANEDSYVSAVYLRCSPVADAEASRFLHPDEYRHYQTIISQARRSSFIRGRYCAKQALQYFLPRQPADLCIENGVFGQPLLLDNSQNLGLSIAHSEKAATATAFPEHYPMGIDVEEWNPDLPSTLEQHWTLDEQRLLKQTTDPFQPLLFWSAKEALAKVLKTGLTLSLFLLEIVEFKSIDGWQIFHFKHFNQYKALAFRWNKYVVALVVPAKSELIKCQRLIPY